MNGLYWLKQLRKLELEHFDPRSFAFFFFNFNPVDKINLNYFRA